jgi:hypothetical protein
MSNLPQNISPNILPPLVLASGIRSLSLQTAAFKSYSNWIANHTGYPFGTVLEPEIDKLPKRSSDSIFINPEPKKVCPSPESSISEDKLPKRSSDSIFINPEPKNVCPSTKEPNSEEKENQDPEWKKFLEEQYPERNKVRPKLSSYTTIEELNNLKPEPRDHVYSKVCSKCHREYAGHKCPRFKGRIVPCPGFARCPTASRNYHLDEVDKKPQTQDQIDKRKEEIAQTLLKNSQVDKKSKRPKPKSIGNIDSYIPEGMNKIDFVNGIIKHGVRIIQQGKDGTLTPQSIKETLKTEVSFSFSNE